MSKIYAKITQDMKTAMKNREKEKLLTIRMIISALKQKAIDEKIEITDDITLAVINKMIKQRHQSIAMYNEAGRDELSAKEQAEINILEPYLPQQMSEEQVREVVASIITQTNSSSMKDMGKVMGAVRPALMGKADIGKVSAVVKELLNN